MARECKICKKRGRIVWRLRKLRGKYNPTTKRKQQVNLQKAMVPKDLKRKEYLAFLGKSVRMCSKCRRTMFKQEKK